MYSNKLFQKFCKERNIKEGTMKGYDSALKKYISFHQKSIDYLINEALKDEEKRIPLKERKIKKRLLDYRSFLLSSSMSPNTAKTYFSKLKTFYLHFEIELPHLPDAKYNNVLIARFINYIMLDGKKSIIEKAVYNALDELQNKLKKEPVNLFEELIDKITPRIEVRPRRIGGATYQIPVEVGDRRGIALALKWLTTSVRKQSGKTLSEKIVKSLIEIQNGTGWAYKKKEEVFRMAEANKAFASYSW